LHESLRICVKEAGNDVGKCEGLTSKEQNDGCPHGRKALQID
jgi:hypothetical protein